MPRDLAMRLVRGRRNRSSQRLLALLVLCLCACASTPPKPLPNLPALTTGAKVAIEVRLTFGADADLDLFVTGPSLETVYFGNTPARDGGRLLEDQRCDASPPRSERVTFPEAGPGRYRVGVHHARACGHTSSPVPFRVDALAGSQTWVIEDTIGAGRFEATVLEFELDIAAPSR